MTVSLAQKHDAELVNEDKAFAHLSYTKGVAAAFDKYLADDAVFLSSTPMPMEGKENFMKLFAGTKSIVIWQPTGAYKDPSGNSGYTHGLSKWTYPAGDSLASTYYVYTTNWLKNKADSWKVTTDIGTEISLNNYPTVSKSKFKLTGSASPVIENTSSQKSSIIVNFHFASARKGNVPALLVKPSQQVLKGLVCFQHGMGDELDKSYFLEEAKLLAENGIASLMIDAPFKRKDAGYMKPGGMRDGEIIETNTIEWQQAIDLLPSLGVKTSSYVFVGQSYGVRVANLLAYLDNRFTKIVAISGITNYAEWMQTTMNSEIAQLRRTISPEEFRGYLNAVAVYDVSLASNRGGDAEFYFQAGRQDTTLTEYDLLSCYEMIKCTKRLDWYDASHTLNDQARADRIGVIRNWIEEKAGR